MVRDSRVCDRLRGSGNRRLHLTDGSLMESESLLVSSVPRTLETKNKILGLELSDVLILLLNVSVENLIFGTTSLKVPMVFGTSLLFIGILFFVKRGKPDLYLQHSLEHLLRSPIQSENAKDEVYSKFNQGRFT